MSETVIEQPPREDTTVAASCAQCGGLILTEILITGTSVEIPYRLVTGAFVQFLDDDGQIFGPWWAFCLTCQRNPIELPEVRAAYQRIKES